MKKTLILIVMSIGAVTANAQCWQKLQAGGNTSHGIKWDGTLWGWGSNSSGTIGDGSVISSNIPKQVGNATNWMLVSLLSYHAMGLRSDGSLWAWGRNQYGQLGTGDNINSAVPVSVSTGEVWGNADAGVYHSLAVRLEGTLWAWGSNDVGQLGNGTLDNTNIPMQIGNEMGWREVSAGHRTSFAIKADGTLWAWGANDNGELGTNNVGVSSSVPVQVGTDTNWESVAAGWFWNLGLKTDGTLWIWGRYSPQNPSGVIAAPVQVGTAADWFSVTGGDDHYAGVKISGTLWAAGENSQGQLGDGTTTYASQPIQIGTDTNWNSVGAAGFMYTTGLKTDGTMLTWGDNLEGQLGDGTNVDHGTPTAIACPQLSRQSVATSGFDIYPNPVSTTVNIQTMDGMPIDKIAICDMTGKVLLEQVGVAGSINVGELPVGVYVVRAYIGNASYQQKLIKE